MALWTFRTPARVSIPLSDGSGGDRSPLWARVSQKQGVAVVKHADGTWAEYPALPSTIEAGADYVFGRTDRSSVPRGRGFGVTQDSHGTNLETPESREFQSPLRIYRGGHVYVINDAMKTELTSAVTTEEAAGYAAYITAGGTTYTGDEIIASGRTPEYEQPSNR